MNRNISTRAIRPEAELLLWSVRARIDAETAARIEALARNTIDWDYCIRIGQSHRVLPLLYRSLNQVCPDAVPGAILEGLRQYFYRNTQRNLFLTSELLKLITAFEQQGISAIPFKGPILAARIYGNIALRQYNDLDLLVRKRDILKAKDVLISQRFTSPSDNSGENSDVSDRVLETDLIAPLSPNFYVFVRDGGSIRVDLQWRITRRLFSSSLDSERFWNTLEPVTLGGRTVLNFPPDVLLWILCVHGCKHSWQRLKWVCDVAQLVELVKEDDRATFIERAIQNGNRRMLFLGLLLAHELLGTRLPAEILKKIRSDSSVQSVAISILDRRLDQADEVLREGPRSVFYFKILDSWGGRFQYCFQYLAQRIGLIFSPTRIDRSFLSLPKGLAFLYYVFRPLRLLVKYSLQPFNRG